MRIALLMFVLALATGCSKKPGNSDKAREIYHCWELGWRIIEGCFASGRPDCDDMADEWFESVKPDVITHDPSKAFASEKERCARTTGVTSWNQLSADDINDEMADALQELQPAVRSRNLPAIRAARAKVRAALGHAP